MDYIADLAMIRMMDDVTNLENDKKNYTNVFSTIQTIFKEEGWQALWNGCEPSIFRGMILNLTMLGIIFFRIYSLNILPFLFCYSRIISIIMNYIKIATFDEIKERLNSYFKMDDSEIIRSTASAIAGIFCSIASLPFDNIKTKL